jgi:anthranilate phosphoribosyltransferase
MLRLLEGEAGPFADLVAVNAGATIHVAGKADTLLEGIDKARASISSGKARASLEALKRASNA